MLLCGVVDGILYQPDWANETNYIDDYLWAEKPTDSSIRKFEFKFDPQLALENNQLICFLVKYLWDEKLSIDLFPTSIDIRTKLNVINIIHNIPEILFIYYDNSNCLFTMLISNTYLSNQFHKLLKIESDKKIIHFGNSYQR